MHKPLSDQEKITLSREATAPFDEMLGLYQLMVAPNERNDFSTSYRQAYQVSLEPDSNGMSVAEETNARLEMVTSETGYRRRTAAAVLGALAATHAHREVRQLAALGDPRVQ